MRHTAFPSMFVLLLSSCLHAVGESDLLQVPGGLVVHVACGDGGITEGLCSSSRYLVHGLDTDFATIALARQRLAEAGRYGQITCDTFDGRRMPYVDDLVNQVIDSSEIASVPTKELARVLAPRGIVLVQRETINQREFSEEQWKPHPLPENLSNWVAYQKRWPAELDEWTHWLHGPDNNAVSRDKQVGVSRNLQWIMPPLWARHHNLLPSISAMVSANGRLYYVIDEGKIGVQGLPDRWNLVARDAFNGLELWRHPIENWGWRRWSDLEVSGTMRFKVPSQLFRRLVAVNDTVFATLGFDQPVVAIDGKTGKITREYSGTERTAEILCDQGQLLLARTTHLNRPGNEVLVVDIENGETLWTSEGHRGTSGHGDELQRFTDAYLTVGGGRLYFIDGDQIVALDRATGERLWQSNRPEMPKDVLGHYSFNHANLCTLVYHNDVLLLGQMYPFKDNLNARQQKSMVLKAMDARNGQTKWEFPGMSLAHFTPPDVFVVRDLVWTMKEKEVALLGLDMQTGEVRCSYPVKEMLVGHHHRCYRNKATEQFYLAGEEGIEYIDFSSGDLDVHHWMRGACAYGILPANGCIYLPTHPCGCHRNAKLNGFIALTTGSVEQTTQANGESNDRIERGPAFGENSIDASPNSEDWPQYKSNADRSNRVMTHVAADLQPTWTKHLAGQLTAPIIANGRLFVASISHQQLYCLNASTGETIWARTISGPLDTPPTYYRGQLFFGTRSGYMSTISADTGRLIWRYQAAPVNTRLTAFGRLESPWPVHGSVLVEDDRVYCVAGRSMHLDGGLTMLVLDANTGDLLQRRQLAADTAVKGELEGAVLPDILVGGQGTLTMRGRSFSKRDLTDVAHGESSPTLSANDGGLLDPTWFNSSFWNYRDSRGQMLVIDDPLTFGIAAYEKFVGKSYPHDIFTPGKGYRLYAIDNSKSTIQIDSRGNKKKTKSKVLWEVRVGLRAEAMLATNRHLCLAGSPDSIDSADPWAALDGRHGGVLRLVSRESGETVSEYPLAAIPVYDGMAAARGRIFISLADGSLVCFAGQ